MSSFGSPAPVSCAWRGRARRRAAFRLRPALRGPGIPGVSVLGGGVDVSRPAAARRRACARARIYGRRCVTGFQGEWQPDAREARTMRPCWKAILPIGACASTGSSPILWTCRLRNCGQCRSGPRSPAMTASKGGAPSANGKGVPLAIVLQRATLLPAARFVVFHCADVLERARGRHRTIL